VLNFDKRRGIQRAKSQVVEETKGVFEAGNKVRGKMASPV
jgi:hypothetical protein